MKYISLTIVALYLGIVASFAQTIKRDSVPYEKRKLKFEQVDLVNSYYHQDGNNSAVTGGIGTEKLTDFSTSSSYYPRIGNVISGGECNTVSSYSRGDVIAGGRCNLITSSNYCNIGLNTISGGECNTTNSKNNVGID